jgi:hypothetical protein
MSEFSGLAPNGVKTGPLSALAIHSLDYAPGSTGTFTASGFGVGDIGELTSQVEGAGGSLQPVTFDQVLISDGTVTPIVTMDADDYPAGSAYITASDFRIGAEIDFTIEVIDPETHAHLWTGPVWDVVDGSAADDCRRSDGTVRTRFYVTHADTTIRLTTVDKATGQTATTILTGSISANLNDWQDGPAPATASEPSSWTNGNLNASKAPYAEGEAVPFETVFTGLSLGQTYSITLSWGTTKSGLHAFDSLTSYNYSWAASEPREPTQFPSPLLGTSLDSQFNVTQSNPFDGASLFNSLLDPNLAVNGFSGPQHQGNATITSVTSDMLSAVGDTIRSQTTVKSAHSGAR